MPVATSAHGVRESKDTSRFSAAIKELIKTDNSERTSTPNTFAANSYRENKCTAMVSLPHGDRVSLHYSFLLFLSLQMNEILKMELQFFSSIFSVIDAAIRIQASTSTSRNFQEMADV